MIINTRTKVATDQVWYSRDIVCGIESQKATKSAPITVNARHGSYRKFSYSHVQNMLQPHRQSTKLRKMIVNIKSMVLIKFGTSRILREELRAKKLRNVY